MFDDRFLNYEISKRNTRRKAGSFLKTAFLVAACCLMTGLITGRAIYMKLSDEIKTLSLKTEQNSYIISDSDISLENALLLATDGEMSVKNIAKKVGPSIVGIRMVTKSPRYWYSTDDMDESEYEGSGIIISKDGYIMTNYHVVQYADPKNSLSKNTTLEVFLSDKQQAAAKFIGGDSKTDLAVIKIDKKIVSK